MLLKCTPDGSRPAGSAPASPALPQRAPGMKMTMSTAPTMSARVHRKVMRAPHKRTHSGKMTHYAGKISHHGGKPHMKFGSTKLAHYARLYSGKPHASKGKMLQQLPRPLPDPCDNSNDSGLGPDQHIDPTRMSTVRFSDQAESDGHWSEDPEAKRRRMEIKLESDNANDNYSFPVTHTSQPGPSNPAIATGDLTTLYITDEKNPRAACSSILSPAAESPGKLLGTFKSHGKLANTGKLGSRVSGSPGKFVSGKIASTGKLANALARRRAYATSTQTGPPTLSAHLPSTSRDGRVQLQIVCQPETQHRARYQTEGSRGAVKDNSGNGFPIVKLVGYDKPAVLEVFIGTDTGRVAPHMFYQACRVSGKNSTPCKERKEDGTVLIEIDLDPMKNWQVTCDCVGILKERNVDVEHRFGDQLPSSGAVSRGKKKSTRCRMVFRTQIVTGEGVTETLQVCSSQIICTQPPGVPEICRKSLVSCPASGGLELYLLGKNFLKDTKVVLVQTADNRPVWEEQVAPDKEFLQQTHLVCCVPPYVRADIPEPVCVQLYVCSGGKASESHTFYYTPLAHETGPQHTTRHAGFTGGMEEARPVMLWGAGAMMPPPALPPRRPSLILPDPHSPLGLKSELADDSSQHSLVDVHSENSNMSFVNENSCDASMHGRCDDVSMSAMDQSDSNDAMIRSRLVGLAGQSQMMMSDDLKVVDLRLKSESMGVNDVDYGRYAPNVKLSPGSDGNDNRTSPLASFTQQLQAIHTQVQTDKMVESVTAAIFQDNVNSIYSDQPILIDSDIKAMNQDIMMPETTMKAMNPDLMMRNPTMQPAVLSAAIESQPMSYVPYKLSTSPTLSEQTAQMEKLVDDAMQASGVMLPGDAAKLEALVNSTVDNHMCSPMVETSSSGSNGSHTSHASDVLLSPSTAVRVPSAEMLPPLPSSTITPDVILNPQVSPSLLCDNSQRLVAPMMTTQPTQDDLMLMSDPMQMPTVKTPPAAVKSMILNAAAEILTSDSAMNALVTSAINTANILTTENASAQSGCSQTPHNSPPQDGLQSEQSSEAPMSAMSQAVSQAVTQAVSQAVSHAVSQAVSQEMTAPVQGLNDMSDSDLLSYINPSCFDTV